MKAVIKLFLVLITAFNCACSQKDAQIEELQWRVDKIHSQILKEDIGFRVYLPEGYEKSHERYSVLFLTSNWKPIFSYTVGVVKLLSDLNKIPKLIIVSADCNRWRDMTPTVTPSHGLNTGGADKYLNFFEKELIPLLKQKYRFGSERIIWSHSIEATFALYAILSKPGLFQTVLASSPWFPYELSDEEADKYGTECYNHEKGFIIKSMEEFLSKRANEKNFLFMSIGNEPELMPYFEQAINILERTSPKGLIWKSSKWLNENHQSMLLYSLTAGLLARYSQKELN